MTATERARTYRLQKTGPGIGDMILKPLDSCVFDVGEEQNMDLKGKRFIARKQGEEVTFQINEGTRDEPRMRNPTVDEMNSGLRGLSVELDALSSQADNVNGPAGYTSDVERDKIRDLNQLIDALKRRIYSEMELNFDPNKREVVFETEGRAIRARRNEDWSAVVEVREQGKEEWRPADDHEKEMMLRHMRNKLECMPGEWGYPIVNMIDSMRPQPTIEQSLEKAPYPTEPHLDVSHASFRFFEPVYDKKGEFGLRDDTPPKYLKGFGFQLRPLAHRRRDTSKYPWEYTPPLCGFYVKGPHRDWAPAELPDMEKTLDGMRDYREKGLAKNNEELHILNYMINAASQEIQRVKEQESK